MKADLSKINFKPKTLEEALEVIGELAKIIVELKAENDYLREQLNNNSRNSSLPPSKDLKKKKIDKPKSDRKRGGQPGHKASQRRLISEDKLSDIIDCKPSETCLCGGSIKLKKIEKRQVFEIPQAIYEVIEYRIHSGCCESCDKKYVGQLSEGVSQKGFGPRAHAMLSLLTSKYRLSKRQAQAWFKDVYQMPICLGSVSNIERTVSDALKPVHEEVFSLMKQEKVMHIDETGHNECNKSAWAWILSAKNNTCFVLNKSRGKKIAKELIGDFHGRIIVSDRYAGYNYLPAASHQICWAHLKRDFQKISERPDEAGSVGKRLLKAYKKLFCFWKTEFKEEPILPQKQKRRLKYFRRNMLKWLNRGADCSHKKTARTCRNILEFKDSLWHFFENKGVPPTNNHAEQQLRSLVISKKLTFGTQSSRGSRFIERIFTVTTSCKQQNRDVLEFMLIAVKNFFLCKNAPSLQVLS